MSESAMGAVGSICSCSRIAEANAVSGTAMGLAFVIWMGTRSKIVVMQRVLCRDLAERDFLSRDCEKNTIESDKMARSIAAEGSGTKSQKRAIPGLFALIWGISIAYAWLLKGLYDRSR